MRKYCKLTLVLALRLASHALRIRVLALAFTLSSPAHGIDWVRTDIAAGPESGSRCAVAIDRAGRTHVAFVRNNGTTASLNYAMRANKTEGFTGFTTEFSSTLAADFPQHIALDVGTGFQVQIACVDGSGDVRVYQGAGFSPVTVASGASFQSTGGISLVAAGNGSSRSALAYTAADGSARYTVETSPGNWSSTEPVTTGANSGLAPKLIYAKSATPGVVDERYVVVCYDDTLEQVRTTSRTFFGGWGSTVKIDDAPAFTRVGADTRFGKIAVAYTIDSFPSSPIVREVRYAENIAGAWNGPWAAEVATTAGELETPSELFGSTVDLKLAADGNPWIAYTRNQLSAFVPGSLDVRARRFIPGNGWELSVVETFAGSGSGFLSDRLALATSGEGDPALVYERDPGAANSTFVFARPFSRPWAVGTPETLLDFDDNSFAPAMATGPDGTVHLVVGTAKGTGDIFDLLSETGSVLISYHQGGAARLRLVGGSTRSDIAHGITVTADGIIHLVALRQTVGSAGAGILTYWQIRDGVPISESDISLTDGSAVDVAMASPGPMSMGHDAAGNVFLAFKNEASGMTLARLQAGSVISGGISIWSEVAGYGGTAHGIDLAARGDGGVGVTLRTSTGLVILVSNMDRSTGELVGYYEGTTVAAPPAADAMESTTCLIMDDGLLRIAYSWGDTLNYIRFSPSGSGVTLVASGLSDPDFEMVAAGDIIHLCSYDETLGGSLRHISFRDSAPSAELEGGTFATPGAGLLVLGGPIAAAVDRHGYPIMAAAFTPASIGYRETIVARPADALDTDADGVPLIAENAYQMNPGAKDAGLLPRGGTLLRPVAASLLPRLFFHHRYPDVPETPVPVATILFDPYSAQYGEYRYILEGSADLSTFTHSSITGFGIHPFLSTPSAPVADVRERDFGIDISTDYLLAHPKLFLKLEVTRDR